MKLTTVANEFMGIAAGLDVFVLFNYLTLATDWKAQLPQQIRDDLDCSGRKCPYEGFPNYETGDLELTAAQANLLANHASWVVEHNQPAYVSVFSAP